MTKSDILSSLTLATQISLLRGTYVHSLWGRETTGVFSLLYGENLSHGELRISVLK